ncbi:hypothetical protein [Nocardia arizonensis]|uniref:hypothetical protein n=1 Tax=Nocardia arizonensis TaxID=1141647 RepID=UPI0006D28F35|nr:hypothetical protein [Nocardia arizonensis]
MSTDDAGNAKNAEHTEADDDAANTGDSVAADNDKTAATSLEKKAEKKKDEPAKRPAPEPESAGDADGSPKRTPLIAALFVTGILLVAAVTAGVVFYLEADSRGDKLDAIEDATHAACVFGRNVSTYDYNNNLDGYFTTVKGGATGEFLEQFSDASDALKEAMVKAQVKSWVADAQCGFQSGDTESAKVLVTLTQLRANFTQSNPERQYVAVIADMKNEGGTWKASKLDSPMLSGAGGGLPGGTPAPEGQAPTANGAPAPSQAPAPR